MKIPIRLRLTLVFALGMAVVLSGFGAFVFVSVARDLMASIDFGLRARAQVISDGLGRRASSDIASGPLIDPDESFAQVLDGSGRVLLASSAMLQAPVLGNAALRSVAEPTFFVAAVPRIDTSDPVRLLVVPVTSRGQQRLVVVGATLGDRSDALRRLLIALAVGGPIALLLASAAAWLVAGGALRPVERMRQEAGAISASEPDRRLPVPSTGDELARLGTTLNTMLDRLQESMEQERRFLDNASHELRTPLSILKMELDLALARSRTPEELAAALRSALAETDRLVRLAEDLLVLARQERGRLPVHRVDVALEELVRETADRYTSQARSAGATIRLDVQGGTARLDPARVRQAMENLLDNALRHAEPGDVITLRSERTDGMVTIAVDDSGPGFPDDLLESAFEPFARSETDGNGEGSRGAALGAGLGLAIVRAVAEAHGGSAKAENLPGGGARVTLLIRA